MIFNFAFWNCAVSPPGKNKSLDDSAIYDDIVSVIKYILFEREIDFLALCEVNNESFGKISLALRELGLSFKLLNNKTETGSRFDIAYIYVAEKIEVIPGVAHTGNVGTSAIKIAQQLKVFFKNEGSVIQMLVSHWPSRLQNVAEDFRNKCSIGLRGFVDSLVAEGQQVILMGDYNDDPYAHSLFKNMSATNDRGLVISKPDFWLYNPFWKTLFPKIPYSYGEDCHDFGTCYSKSNNRNSWSAFDQIIFSGSFLTNGPWYLKEAFTGTIMTEALRKAILDENHAFDHVPIVGCVELKR